MEKILFPIQSGDKGSEVRNLHEAFVKLSEKMSQKDFEVLLKNKDFREIYGR